MSGTATYETLRALADSWGLATMTLVFAGLCLWPFRPGAGAAATRAANAIFEDTDDDQ